ncbi:MAG: hypothetical protein J6J00_08990 [Treponema sp.]|nr:hypothetical protein [Treponema sp.]MBQ5343860.1 hypothetical protein [Acidaminococcaceae bacterium]
MKINPTYETLWGFIAAGLLALILWCYQPFDSIEAWKAGILLFLCISSFWYAILIQMKSPVTSQKNLLTIVPIDITTMNNKLILVVKPNAMLFMGAYVTIHKKINEIESYVATGQVTNIQLNQMIQITIITPCLIAPEDVPSLIPKLGLSVNAPIKIDNQAPENQSE